MAKDKSRIFRFKQFSVNHVRSAMKVGTDGVLIGAWTDVSGARKVLDVGCGCGLIALMVAQRNPSALIDAIDIDNEAVAEANENFANSLWGNRLKAEVRDFNKLNNGCYDVIVSNPPFFVSGILPPHLRREQARHTTSLTIEALISHARELLSADGLLSIITPADSKTTVITAVTMASMKVVRMTLVYSRHDLPAKRILWQITKRNEQNRDVPTHYDELVIENKDHSFTEDYIGLTRDFYLNF